MMDADRLLRKMIESGLGQDLTTPIFSANNPLEQAVVCAQVVLKDGREFLCVLSHLKWV
jgi:hypothetical protein